ncbi:MAG: flagellar motor protein MotB [Candidatus Gygaella obscura]|nr:flagellar motor protein MotB [Candidatus Gygaella obscura]
MRRLSYVSVLFIVAFVFVLNGCTIIFQKGRRSDLEEIEQLSTRLNDLEQARLILTERLKQEISDKNVRLDMFEKGLVISFVADVLFDSGKAKIKRGFHDTLGKVARVLKENVPDLEVGVEGHTDNVAIKFSRWKDNWELSTQRALSVLRYLCNNKTIDPARLRAIGYGEQKPIATNDSKSGRKLNRRVEIVILPEEQRISKETIRSESNTLPQNWEELK